MPTNFDPYMQGTAVFDPNLEFRKQQKKEEEDRYAQDRLRCLQQGGRWDEASNSCILPGFENTPDPTKVTLSKPQLPNEPQKTKLTTPEVVFDQETGKPTFVNLPDGRKLNVSSAEEANTLVQSYNTDRALPAGSVAAGTARRQLEVQQTLAQLGQVTGISQAELQGLIQQYGLDPTSQFFEGAPGALREAIPGAIQSGVTFGLGAAVAGGIATGAGAGAIGGPWGIAAGAAAGVVFGLWKGLAAGQKAEAKEDVTNAMAEFTQLRRGMSQVGTLASSGYINADEAVELYNAQLSRMLQIEAQIKYLQDTNLKDYLSDGSDDLAKVQTYLAQVAPAYELRIKTALVNPLAKLPYSDIVLEDMAELQ